MLDIKHPITRVATGRPVGLELTSGGGSGIVRACGRTCVRGIAGGGWAHGLTRLEDGCDRVARAVRDGLAARPSPGCPGLDRLGGGAGRGRLRPGTGTPPASDALAGARFVAGLALRDTAGTLHDFLSPSHKAAVFFLLGTECPVSNAYAPEMARIAKDYEPRGIAAFGVHPDPGVTPSVAASHAADYRLGFPILLDPTQELAEAAGAEVTPEAIVIDDGGMVVYRGRIDDTYARDGKRRDRPSTRDLRDVLDAISDGKTPAPTVHPAFGCPLPTPAPVVGDGETVTFSKQIAPILWDHCGRCHRPGEVGPFSLLTLCRRREAGRLPPRRRRVGPDAAVEGVARVWAFPRREPPDPPRAGAARPLGRRSGPRRAIRPTCPTPPKYPDGWAARPARPRADDGRALTPSRPTAATCSAGSSCRLPTDGDRPIAAVEFRPGNRKVVHHARIFVDETPDCRTMTRPTPASGSPSTPGTTSPSPRSASGTPGHRRGVPGPASAGRSRRGRTSPC